MNAAELVVSVRAAGIQSTVGGLNQVEAAGRRANTSTVGLGKGLARTFGRTGALVGVTSLAAGIAVAGKEVIGFDRSMRNVNSIAKLNAQQFKALTAQVNALAGPTAQAPTTLANGLYDLVSSGFKANDAVGILKVSAVAATAGLTDTATATKAVAGVLNAYKLKASDAAKVSDDLFQTVNLGVLSFQDLAQGIGPVLPFAAKLGVNLKQVGAMTATLTKAGIPAAEAFTYQKGAMAALIKPSDQLQAVYKKLGVATGGELIKKTGSLQSALESLFKASGSSTEKFAKLFPDLRGMTAAFAATGSAAAGAKRDLQGFADTSGAARSAFKEQSKSIAVQWDKLKATLSATLNAKVDTTGLASSLGKLNTLLNDFSQRRAGTAGGFFGDAAAEAQKIGGYLKQAGSFAGALSQYGANLGKNLANGIGSSKKVDVAVNMSKALTAINSLNSLELRQKALAITAQDGDAKSKIRRLIALGIPPKTAKVIAAGVPDVQAQIDSLHGKTITIPVNYSAPGFSATPPKSGGGFSKSPPKGSRAAGRGPGAAETALVGEGHGPEWVGNPRSGWGLVSAPTIMGLGAGDYVIPTEPRYRGRWEDTARMLGLPGFKKGKGPSKKELARRNQADARIESAGTQADTAGTRQDIAQGNNQYAFSAARKRRIAALMLERKRIVAELGRAKGSRRVQLLNRLAQVDRDLQQTRAGGYEPTPIGGTDPSSTVGTDPSGNFAKMLEPYDASLALAGLTQGTADDRAALTAKQSYLQRALAGAQASGDNALIAQVATALKDTTDGLANLDSTVSDNTAALQAQADLAKQQLEETRKALNTSQAELRAFGKYVVGVVSGQVGQNIGRGSGTPVPGQMAGY